MVEKHGNPAVLLNNMKTPFKDDASGIENLDRQTRENWELNRRHDVADDIPNLGWQILWALISLAFALAIIWLMTLPMPSYGQDFGGPFGTPPRLQVYTLDQAGSNRWAEAHGVIVQPESAKVPPIPEPSTVAFFAVNALAGFLIIRRKFKKLSEKNDRPTCGAPLLPLQGRKEGK